MLIQEKPLADITWADIEHLVSASVSEGPTLEFKSGTVFDPEKGQSEATARKKARDEVAEAIIALANGYGGLIVIGVGERRERPRFAERVEPIAGATVRAEDLMRAVRDTPIDPPIAGLAYRVLEDKVIVIKVPISLMRPHGFGRPTQAYIRDGDGNRPMSMGDVKAVFAAARESAERIREIRAGHEAELQMLAGEHKAHRLADRSGNPVQRDVPGVYCRISAIPQLALDIGMIDLSNFMAFRPTFGEFQPAFGGGQFNQYGQHTAHGIVWVDRGPSFWSFDERGTVRVIGFHQGIPRQDAPNRHHPGWYSATLLQVMVMADRLRGLADEPEAPFEVDIHIEHTGDAGGLGAEDFQWRPVVMQPKNYIGPFVVAGRNSLEATFRRAETTLANAFGRAEASPFAIDIGHLLAQVWRP